MQPHEICYRSHTKPPPDRNPAGKPWSKNKRDTDSYLQHCGHHPSCTLWLDKKRHIRYSSVTHVRVSLNEVRNLRNNGENIRGKGTIPSFTYANALLTGRIESPDRKI